MARANSTTDETNVQAPKFWYHKPSKKYGIKRKGRYYYLGHSEEEAAEQYLKHHNRIERGLPIIEETEGELTVGDIVNHFLIAKQAAVTSQTLTERSYDEYKKTAARIIDVLGRNTIASELAPADFLRYKTEFSKTRNPIGVGNEITRVKTVFKWAWESDYLDRPVKFGPDFKRPSKRVVRLHRQSKGKTLFSPTEVNDILDAASVHVRGMIFLGINCGFKNADIAQMPLGIFNPDNPWLDWLRPKTGEVRRCPLWPETVEALKLSLRRRPVPTEKRAKDKFFVHRSGDTWCSAKHEERDHLATEFRQIVRRLEVWRTGMGYSWLRHNFRTWADEAKDQPAAGLIMGHADPTMAAVYRHEISDDRLLAVSETVRRTLLGLEA